MTDRIISTLQPRRKHQVLNTATYGHNSCNEIMNEIRNATVDFLKDEPPTKKKTNIPYDADQTLTNIIISLSQLDREVGDSTITTLSVDNFNIQNQGDKRVLSDLLLGGIEFSRDSYMQSKTLQSHAIS